MPARANHLPNRRERIAMQMLLARGELSVSQLHPTDTVTIVRMFAKAWIKRVGANTYRMTSAGEAALKAELREDRRKRKFQHQQTARLIP
jgi:hypothetical protein